MSDVIWYQLWHRYLRGEITAAELTEQTGDEQMSFKETEELNCYINS